MSASHQPFMSVPPNNTKPHLLRHQNTSRELSAQLPLACSYLIPLPSFPLEQLRGEPPEEESKRRHAMTNRGSALTRRLTRRYEAGNRARRRPKRSPQESESSWESNNELGLKGKRKGRSVEVQDYCVCLWYGSVSVPRFERSLPLVRAFRWPHGS